MNTRVLATDRVRSALTHPRVTRAIDWTLNVAVIVGAAVVLLLALVGPSLRASSSRSISGALTSIPQLGYETADRTVVLVLASGCVYCTDSMAALREIASAARGRTGHVRLVAIGAEPASRLRTYLAAHSVTVDGVHSVSPGPVTEFTPRVFVMSRDGAIRRDWVGVVGARRVREILAAAGLPLDESH